MLQTSHTPSDPSPATDLPQVRRGVGYYLVRVVIVGVGVAVGLFASTIVAIMLGWVAFC